MSFLIAHDADINAQDDNGDSALLSACRMGRVQVVQKLFLAGADPDLRNNQASFFHKSPHRTTPNHIGEIPALTRERACWLGEALQNVTICALVINFMIKHSAFQ